LIARAASTSGTVVCVTRLNNDSGNNYTNQRHRGIGSTADAVGPAPTSVIDYIQIPDNAAIANLFGVATITIYGYASTTWLKMIETATTTAANVTTGNVIVIRTTAVWNSTAAVNRIAISAAGGGNLVAGSQLRIYGRL